MAIKDLLALADDKLHEVFASKPHDPTKARAPILKGIDRTHEQFHAATPARGKKWFKVANGVVELNLPFEISGKSQFYIPSERFADFLKKLKDSVTGGELDEEIGQPPRTGKAPATKGRGGKRGPMDPEKLAIRNAKRAATLAAKKAAK